MDSMGLLTDFVTFDPVQNEPLVDPRLQSTAVQNEPTDDPPNNIPPAESGSRPISPFRSSQWLPSPPPIDQNTRDDANSSKSHFFKILAIIIHGHVRKLTFCSTHWPSPGAVNITTQCYKRSESLARVSTSWISGCHTRVLPSLTA